MSKENEVVEVKEKPQVIKELPNLSVMESPQVANHYMMLAKTMCTSSNLIPAHYRGSQADTFIALSNAHELDVNPLTYMQGTFLIHGNVGMYTAFSTALLKKSKVLKGSLKYESKEEKVTIKSLQRNNIAVRAWGIEAETGDKLEGPWVDLVIAEKEGWTKKPGSKYSSMPEVMLRKRAASWFIRENFPEVLMGMHTVEEIQDVGEDFNSSFESFDAAPTADLNDLTKQIEEPKEIEEPKKTPKQKSKSKAKKEVPTKEAIVEEAEIIEEVEPSKPVEQPVEPTEELIEDIPGDEDFDIDGMFND